MWWERMCCTAVGSVTTRACSFAAGEARVSCTVPRSGGRGLQTHPERNAVTNRPSELIPVRPFGRRAIEGLLKVASEERPGELLRLGRRSRDYIERREVESNDDVVE